MFFREKTSKNSKSPVLQLVENERTANGSKQKLIVSLGTKLSIPKEKRSDVARIVKDRMAGQQSLFKDEPELIDSADKIVKKIQTEGKWNSAREQVRGFNKDVKENNVAEIFVDDVQHGYDRQLGSVLIGHCFWERLHFPMILSDCGFSDSQIKNAEISILNRLIAQDSEHSILSWIKTVAIDDILGLDTRKYGDDRFYRISDNLLRNREYIEENLYQREKDLFNLEDSIFLYDLTNTYFEGICAKNPKAEYNGNQKEKRTDCPQVVVALVIDQEGFIKGHRIFNGKMTDVKSLEKILDDLKEDFKDKSLPTIIFDRGMVSEGNLNLLKNKYNDLKYIIACRPNEESLFVKDFQEEEFSLLSDRESSGKPKVEIFLKNVDGVSYLLCKSDGRKAKERAIRNKSEDKLESALNNLSKQIINGRENNPVNIERRIGRLKERHCKVGKYYVIEYQHREFSYTVQEAKSIPRRLRNSLQKLKEKADSNKISFPAIKKKLAEFEKKYPTEYSKLQLNLKEPLLSWNTIDEIENKERNLDGNYLLKTNRLDLSQYKIWNYYMMLTKVENAFKDLKSYLGLRPNFHQKEIRVDGHIFITILAYHLLHAIEYTLHQKGDHSRWSTIRRIVSSHNYSTIQLPTVKGPVINVRKPGIPEGVHIEIYKKLGVPYENLPVTKTIA
ncbi:MAG: transposase [Desulfobacterales bacterium]|nr:transposase [Desulfobacterales bacterium]